MKTAALFVALLPLSAAGCIRARTPDGKLYSCARHTRPIPESAGPLPTFWSGGEQYSCLGPQDLHDGKQPIALDGVKADERRAGR